MSEMNGEWINELVRSVNRNINLETVDGVRRGGRMSGIAFRKFILNNVEAQMPTEIELNGDPNDRVPVDRIQKILIG